MPNQVIRNSVIFAKFTNRKVLRQVDIPRGISKLLLLRNKAAVFGSIVAVVISSIKTQRVVVTISDGPCLERFKTFPFSVVRNSTASVITMLAMGGVVTTALHSCPNAIQAYFELIASICAMFRIGFRGAQCSGRAFACDYLPETSAIGRDALTEVSGFYPRSVSTLAGAEPFSVWASFTRWPWNELMRSGDGPLIEGLVC